MPLSSEDGSDFTGIASIDLDSRCTAWLIETGVDEAPAYVVTNGHCATARNIGPNDVAVAIDASGEATFGLFADHPGGSVELPVASIAYSTMKDRDISLVELATTLGDARALGLVPMVVAGTPPSAGDEVVNVGIPVQGASSDDWVLRRGTCVLGEPVDVVEFTWHWSGLWPNDCPDIRGGSSGSPVLDVGGEVVAMINTTTLGAPAEGGDCYLGKPCEQTPGTIAVVPDRSYAVGLGGLARCFTAGVFDLLADGCPLDQGHEPSVHTTRRAVMPDQPGGVADVDALITGTPGQEYVTKIGPADSTVCADRVGYGETATLPAVESDVGDDATVERSVEVAVSGDDGIYLYCVSSPGDQTHAAVAVIDLDSTPPVRVPELSIVAGDGVFVQPIFSPPELSDYLIKIGPEDVDCDVHDGYVRYRRVALPIAAAELPATVCIVGYDEAGNSAEPVSFLIGPDMLGQPSVPSNEEAPTMTGTDTCIEVSGVVTYRERIALPPGAELVVRVGDVSLADAPATVVAGYTATTATQVPIPFVMCLDPAQLDERHRYALRAELRVDGDLWWTTTSNIDVSATESTVDLVVVVQRV